MGVNRWDAGGGSGQDRRRAGSRAGREPTMCPFGRTPLIPPLQLEINESLILHPLLLLPLFLFLLPLLHPTIMSFTVDDLVASLSGNHIGQEAIDLAALQVPFISRSSSRVYRGTNPPFYSQSQLAQSLYCPQQATTPTPGKPSHCNTPLTKTPSSYVPWAERGAAHPCDTVDRKSVV